MTLELLGLVVLLTVFALIAIEVPIGIALTFAGALGIWLFNGFEAFSAMRVAPYLSSAKYALVVIPMFVLLGAIVSHSGIADRIFAAANIAVGKLPGGLGAGTVLATAMFSGISGSSAADVAAFGRVATMQMSRNGYDRSYAAAIIAAAGSFAALIPPSVAMIIYALLANVSIGAMLLAGIIPGALSCVALAGFVVIQGFRRRALARKTSEFVPAVAKAPVLVGQGASARGTSLSDMGMTTPVRTAPGVGAPRERRWNSITGVLFAVILFVVVMGGIYSGVYTPTESASVGALAALILGVIAVGGRWKRVFGFTTAALGDTATTTSMIFLLLLGGAVFSYFTSTTGLAASIAQWVAEMSLPPGLIVAFMLLVMLLMGTVMDGLTIMLLTVPILAPVVIELGFDGVWFGILVLKAVEIGLITPPVGLNVYIISGLVPGVTVQRVFRFLVPFVVLDVSITAILFAFPEIALWLPRSAGLL